MVAAIGAVAGVAGAAISAGSASDAAGAQSDASQAATMQRAMAAQQMRSDLKPWVDTGVGANNKLNQLLGLGLGSSGMINGMQSGLSRDQVRQQLLSQYSKSVMTPQGTESLTSDPAYQRMIQMGLSPADALQQVQNTRTSAASNAGTGNGLQVDQGWIKEGGGGPGSLYADQVDENGLNAAIQKYYDDQAAQQAALANDPQYGSLLKAFHNGAEFDSGPTFSFTGQDLKTDPGYQFGLNQGTQGIERGQASRGNFLSGAAMKELTRFNEDYAGTKFNEGFNRASSTYGTNLARRQNEWNTNLGAYNDNRNRVFNFLTGVSSLGQASAAGVASNNQQVANANAGSTQSAGNANAAASIVGGNALQTGINQAANSFNSQNINSAGGWNNLLSGGGQSAYDFGFNGQSNPANQAGLTNLMNSYTG